jgi:hypothetical protein
MFPLIKKVKDNFILNLNKDLYKEEIVDKALAEDKDWVRKLPSKEKTYIYLELNTQDIKEVLTWANYLLYLSKTS